MRIAVGGFLHETNTFALTPHDLGGLRTGRRIARPDGRWRDFFDLSGAQRSHTARSSSRAMAARFEPRSL